jgi:hypothetical protein
MTTTVATGPDTAPGGRPGTGRLASSSTSGPLEGTTTNRTIEGAAAWPP